MFIRRENFNQFIKMYPIITSIICLNTLLYFAINFPIFPKGFLLEYLIGANIYIEEGQLWRLITPIFLHSSLIHFIFNTFAIMIFGPAIEQMLKSLRFLFFYLVCGVGANIVTFFIQPLTYSHLGASGAIFGLLGFYLSIVIYRKQFLSRQDQQMIKVLTFIALITSFIQPNINITAHFSGYIIGFLLATFMLRKHMSFDYR